MSRIEHDCAKCLLPIVGRVYEVFGLTYHERCAPKQALTSFKRINGKTEVRYGCGKYNR